MNNCGVTNIEEGKYGLGQSKECADLRFSGAESAAVLSAVDGFARSGHCQPGFYFPLGRNAGSHGAERDSGTLSDPGGYAAAA
ncbi:hypothetical protein D3C80_1144280 [compost metagenome]